MSPFYLTRKVQWRKCSWRRKTSSNTWLFTFTILGYPGWFRSLHQPLGQLARWGWCLSGTSKEIQLIVPGVDLACEITPGYPRMNNYHLPWQVQFNVLSKVVAVQTQSGGGDFITSYRLEYSEDCITFHELLNALGNNRVSGLFFLLWNVFKSSYIISFASTERNAADMNRKK